MKMLTLSDGRTITMRPPTEAEVLAYLDRRADIEAGLRPSHDATDDGDKQLEACVTDPPPAELAEILEDYPLLSGRLAEAFQELAGGEGVLMRRDDLIGPEYAKAGKRLIGFLFNPPPPPPRDGDEEKDAYAARVAEHDKGLAEQLIVLTKLSRFEVKAVQFQAKKEGRRGPLPSAQAAMAKQHVVTPLERPAHRDYVKGVFASAPLLVPNLGLQLFMAAAAKLADDAGKA